MSLVGYDVSSGSDDDNEITDQTETPSSGITTASEQGNGSSSKTNLSLSNTLPQPKENRTTTLFGFAGGSSKGAIRITAPEIPVLDSDDSDGESESAPKRKKIQPSKSRSGLFDKLPAPRNAASTGKHSNTSFVPYVFTKPKKDDQEKAKKIITPKIVDTDVSKTIKKDSIDSSNKGTVPSIAEIKRRSAQAAAKLRSGNMAKPVSDDKDSDEEPDTGFFSYVEKVPEADITELELPPTKVDLGNKLAPDLPDPVEHHHHHHHLTDTDIPYQVHHTEPIESNSSFEENTEDLMRIQGKRNRNEQINFIDIHADDALVGNKEMLLKQISEEKSIQRPSHSSKKNNAPGGALKRKHQLSYLVHQAKSRELELKNSWAQNRMTKQQTQSKYGF